MHVCFLTRYNHSEKVVTHPLIRGWNLVNIGTLQYFIQNIYEVPILKQNK